MEPRIFVAIGAYRDAELIPTVRDLFAKAAHPERIDVGVCWQGVPEDDAMLGPVPYPAQVHLERHHARDSKGACWAKGRALDLRHDEPYTLLGDSHLRFCAGWDAALVEMLARCDSPRPVLSTYPAPYRPAGALGITPERLEYATPVLCAADFGDEHIPRLIAQNRALAAPAPNPFVAGGFMFAPSRLFDDVPMDPGVFFLGEEMTFAARAFTWGWDAFAPDACVAHHFYGRLRAPKIWQDNRDWSALNARSYARVKHLLGIERATDPAALVDLDRYALGPVRSLTQFERFAGVNFRARTVTDAAKRGEYTTARALPEVA